jgi:uncharacterized protein (TIGR02466 family)
LTAFLLLKIDSRIFGNPMKPKIECDNLFPQRVWKTDLDLDCKELEKFVYDLEKENPKGVIKSNAKGWQSRGLCTNDYTDEIYQNLIQNLDRVVNTCAESSKIPRLAIGNLWFNINRGYNFNRPHTHPKSVLSGAFYIKAEGNEGAIEFLREDNAVNFLPEIRESSFYLSASMKYSPKVNRLLVFGSWMPHWVEPNISKFDRISMSFNTHVI